MILGADSLVMSLSQIALGYVFVTILVALIAPNASPQPATLDAQSIVICAIAAVLSFFTGSMTVSHIILILKARSTIEDISASDMKRRETSALNRVYPLFALKAKKRERNEWNRVWGRLDKEANLFWQGSNKKNWELIMGNSWWKWIITPPKYVPDDGLSYKPNPRRGSNGEWKTRDQWPREYQ
jgi:palmitoyltransferase